MKVEIVQTYATDRYDVFVGGKLEECNTFVSGKEAQAIKEFNEMKKEEKKPVVKLKVAKKKIKEKK